MSYDLSARTNGDTPPPAADDNHTKIVEPPRDDESERQVDAATSASADGLDGQEAPRDSDSVGTDSVDAHTADDARNEQVYQEGMPTDVATPQATAIWSEETVNDMRERWQAVQLRFVDDPAAVVGEMQALVGQAMQALSAAWADRQRELDAWSHSGGHDTEQLRVAVKGYRDFYELLLMQAGDHR